MTSRPGTTSGAASEPGKAAGDGLPAPLREGCDRAPAEAYDVALADLDGVIYRGARAVAGAADAVREAQALGMRFAYVTNNALRTPETVADHLTELGVPATPQDVVTSAQAAARLLQERLPDGDAVLVSGGAGLRAAVEAAGLRVVAAADDRPSAVVCGFDPTLDYARLAEAALAVRAGAFFVASNLDATVPTERGLLPGNGALVSVISTATGRRPVEAGKPERALHQESIRRSNARRPLIVGDRLDTDIEAGVRWSTPSLLVLTGVTDAAGLLQADQLHRPSLLAADLAGLLQPHPAVTCQGNAWRCGGWQAEADGGVLRLVAGDADRSRSDADALDALRAAAVAAWQAADAGSPVHEVVSAPPGSGLNDGPLER
jgi:HAD superfamily hydrolase (TIGR01457 family)